LYGANVTLVDGLISDCRPKWWRSGKKKEGWFDISTLKEPFRIEGKEDDGVRNSSEQLGWGVSSGGFSIRTGRRGVGLIGNVEGVHRTEKNWAGSNPASGRKMIAVQIGRVRLQWQRLSTSGEKASQMWQNAEDVCIGGFAVPKPYGDYIMLEILKEVRRGLRWAFPDEQNPLRSLKDWAKKRGGFFSRQKGAGPQPWAYDHLIRTGYLKPGRQSRAVQYRFGGSSIPT